MTRFLFTIIVTAALAAPAAAQQEVRLLNAFDMRYPPSKILVQKFADTIEQKSGNKVKFRISGPEVVNAFNVTGEDSWILEIAVIDVEHLDAVVTKFCILTETSTSIVLNMPRENAAVLPARRENIKPAIRKVTGR